MTGSLKAVVFSLFLLLPLIAAANTTPAPVIDKQMLAERLALQTRLPRHEILATLEEARFIDSVIERITSPYEARPYAEYRPLFVTDGMRSKGRAYLHKHRAIFSHVERKYRVESEVLAAILGLETRFGQHRGRDRILDSLYTLAVGYPRRSQFFTRELGELLLLAREEGLQADAIRGSYAGAFGATQFIPSSFRAYAVDENGDGRRDVWNSSEDIIASVANYFHRHGWRYGRPVAAWLPGNKDDYPLSLRQRAERGFGQWSSFSEFGQHLPRLSGGWRDNDKVTLIEMQTSGGPRLALVHYNFYVITRWNRSYNYAMATTELAAMLGCESCRVE